jgi:hypothetical protein
MKQLFFKNGALLIAVIALFYFFRIYGFFSNPKSNIIRSDGIGYYSYLPALFIYHDLSHSFLEGALKKYYEGDQVSPNIKNVDGKQVNKYYSGVSILILPFFTVAHLTATVFHQDADGYSTPYQYAVGIAAIFYLLMGCWFVQKLLILFGASSAHAFLITFCIVFGTNLSHCAIWEPSFSHVYSFACIAGFLYCIKHYTIHYSAKSIAYAIVLFSLICLIRPINILILLCIPFIAGSPENLKKSLRIIFSNLRSLIFSLVVFLSVISYQLFIWYQETGHLIIWSYSNERFFFTRPEMINILFSYRKGLFVWTPLTFISLLGFIYLFKKSRYLFYTLFSFFFIIVYVMSCWWTWEYGMGFGCRPMIDYFALLALLLFFSFQLLNTKLLKSLFTVLVMATIILNQVQAYQYRHYILHWSLMDKEKYWKVFMKTGDKWAGYLWNQKFTDQDSAQIFMQSQQANAKMKFSEWLDRIKKNKNSDYDSSGKLINYKNSFPFVKPLGRARITLKSKNGNYVSVEQDLNDELRANRKEAQKWETFTILLFEEGKCFLKSSNNLFVSSDKSASSKLFANRQDASTWELFTITNVSDDIFAFKDCDSKFVLYADSLHQQLIAMSDTLTEKEMFIIDLK